MVQTECFPPTTRNKTSTFTIVLDILDKATRHEKETEG